MQQLITAGDDFLAIGGWEVVVLLTPLVAVIAALAIAVRWARGRRDR